MKQTKKSLTPEQLTVLVCCHKPCSLPSSDYLLPVHVGAACSVIDLEMQRDDQVNGLKCDNISYKNPSYCELTAIYWAWKNLKSIRPRIEFVGLNHYRRYFALGKRSAFTDRIFMPSSQVVDYEFDINYLSEKIDADSILIAKETRHPYMLAIDYSAWNLCKDLRILYQVIADLHPQYEQSFLEKMCKSNTFSMFNMFLMPWDEFDSYCTWLFSILFEVESRIDTSSYDSNYARIYGYMAERLLNIWLLQSNKRVLREPVYFYDDARPVPTSHLLARDLRARLSFVFNKPLSQRGCYSFFRYPN